MPKLGVEWGWEGVGFVFPRGEFPLTPLMTEILISLLLRLSALTQKLHCPYHLQVRNNPED